MKIMLESVDETNIAYYEKNSMIEWCVVVISSNW